MVAHYSWPLVKKLHFFTTHNKAPKIALGLCPHSNEPLGSVVLPHLKKFSESFLVIENIDPPPAKSHQFNFNWGWRDFLLKFHLPPLEEQVEFSYTSTPKTFSEKRAYEVYRLLKRYQISLFLMIHNDPFASIPYFYAPQKINKTLERDLQKLIPFSPFKTLPEIDFTEKLSAQTYRYFPSKHIAPKITSQAAGIFLNQKYIPTLTLELPMFAWKSLSPSLLNKKLFFSFWKKQPSLAERKKILLHSPVDEASFYPAALNLEYVLTVLAFLENNTNEIFKN